LTGRIDARGKAMISCDTGHHRGARLGAAALVAGVFAAVPAAAQLSLPDIVSPPKGLNLGSTSFFDGFGRTTEGWTWLQYGRYEDIDRITGPDGHNSPNFKGTHIQVFAALTQFSYYTGWHPFGGDNVGFSAAMPLINLNAHFADSSPVKLASNGFGIGDLVWGPIYQSRPYIADGRPIFSWRCQLLILSPTGDFNKHDAISQGAGMWAINPYIAATYLPTSRLEISTRFNYQYNLETSNFADPPPIPGVVYSSGQAGPIIYDNFDASYQITEKIHLGINGYVLDELTPDRTNHRLVAHSRLSEVAVGPGARYVFDVNTALNMNIYLPVESANGSPGPKLNFQFVHRF
jgi:hypothetical protein